MHTHTRKIARIKYRANGYCSLLCNIQNAFRICNSCIGVLTIDQPFVKILFRVSFPTNRSMCTHIYGVTSTRAVKVIVSSADSASAGNFYHLQEIFFFFLGRLKVKFQFCIPCITRSIRSILFEFANLGWITC